MRVVGGYPPGTIAIVSGDLTRYREFTLALLALRIPAGTRLAWAAGVGIAENLNRAVREWQGEWLWVLGDDHAFSSELLLQLLDRQVDIVAPLCARRKPPLQPLLFGDYDIERHTWPVWGLEHLPPDGGLLKVGACNGAGMLIQRRILDRVPPPLFEIGRVRPDGLNEDLWFYKKARDAGLDVYVDCDHPLSHISTVSYTPKRMEHGWGVAADLDNDVILELYPEVSA